jgi:glyoxylase-like metal-dependent hydrolase (beta-lactamase superfamily II)
MDVVGDVARTIGAEQVKTIQYSGNGTIYILGQSVSPDAAWPRFNLTSYTALVDYEHGAMREENVRTQYEAPPRGGGNQPIFGERRTVAFVSGENAWTVVGDTPAAPSPLNVTDRQAQIWLTPHGWVKAAQSAAPTLESRNEGGKQLTVVSFTAHGKYKVNGYVNEQNLLEKVETWIPNPLFGDMLVETSYSDYRNFGGVQFPGKIQTSQGGHPTLDLAVTDVQANVPTEITVPEAIPQASATRVDSTRVADGVWFVAGGSHNSVAVEFRDFVTVVEGPLDEERSMAVIDEVKRLIPGKPIRYVVNTHHHIDHSGGLRTYVAEGATVVTHQMNQPFYERLFQGARTVSADKLSQNPRPPTFETMTDKHSITDGARTLDLYHIEGNGHNDGIVMAYLPRERVLIEADVFTPPPPNAPPPAEVSGYTSNLDENIRRLRLNPQQILPLHGRIVGMADLRKAVGGAS